MVTQNDIVKAFNLRTTLFVLLSLFSGLLIFLPDNEQPAIAQQEWFDDSSQKATDRIFVRPISFVTHYYPAAIAAIDFFYPISFPPHSFDALHLQLDFNSQSVNDQRTFVNSNTIYTLAEDDDLPANRLS